MRTLHVGLRVEDLERSLGFYTSLGYEVVGTVPETEFGSLTMLKLPGDEFVGPGARPRPHARAGRARRPQPPRHPGRGRARDGRAPGCARIEAEEPSSPDGSADFWTTWLTDPDGYRIELVQWPTGHADGLTRADFPGHEPPSATAFDESQPSACSRPGSATAPGHGV